MKKTCSFLAVLAAILISAQPALARLSPHETISKVVDGDRVTIVYGRPYTKNPKTGEVRKIWGELVPYGKVWRTGADEATFLITQKPLVIGGTPVPAGAYTLFTLPQEDGTAKLIISKDLGEWGLQYKEADDFARVDLKKAAPDTAVDEFTMGIGANAAGGGTITLSWENTAYSVDFTVQK